jgi:hypothetical protein
MNTCLYALHDFVPFCTSKDPTKVMLLLTLNESTHIESCEDNDHTCTTKVTYENMFLLSLVSLLYIYGSIFLTFFSVIFYTPCVFWEFILERTSSEHRFPS